MAQSMDQITPRRAIAAAALLSEASTARVAVAAPVIHGKIAATLRRT